MTQLDKFDTRIRSELIVYFDGLWEQLGAEKVIANPRITVGPLRETKGAWGAAIIGLPQLYIDVAISLWPTKVIEVLLAHEVAHFYHMAVGKLNPIERDEEDAVDSRIAEWGYDPLLVSVCGAFQIQMDRAPSWEEVIYHRKHGKPIERSEKDD